MCMYKNTVHTSIESQIWSIHFHAKRLYVHIFDIAHIFDIVDTPFSYERVLMNLQGKGKYSACDLNGILHILRFYFVGQACASM